MKLLGIALLVSTFACSSGMAAEEPAAPAVSTDLLDEAAASVVPGGTFASVDAFCEAQKRLVAPRLAEMNQSRLREGVRDGESDLVVTPFCKVSEDTLERAKVTLGGSIREVKAVVVEAGFASETYIVTRTNEGWSAIRTPILTDAHDDPGCPSIERPTAIASVRVQNGLVVITNEAGRYWLSRQEAGELTLTYARACTPGAACGAAAVISAKAVARDVDTDKPTPTHLFATTYAVTRAGAIEPATDFDESSF